MRQQHDLYTPSSEGAVWCWRPASGARAEELTFGLGGDSAGEGGAAPAEEPRGQGGRGQTSMDQPTESAAAFSIAAAEVESPRAHSTEETSGQPAEAKAAASSVGEADVAPPTTQTSAAVCVGEGTAASSQHEPLLIAGGVVEAASAGDTTPIRPPTRQGEAASPMEHRPPCVRRRMRSLALDVAPPTPQEQPSPEGSVAASLDFEPLRVPRDRFNDWQASHKLVGTKYQRRKGGAAAPQTKCPWPNGNADCPKCLQFFPRGWFTGKPVKRGVFWIVQATHPAASEPCADPSDIGLGRCSGPTGAALPDTSEPCSDPPDIGHLGRCSSQTGAALPDASEPCSGPPDIGEPSALVAVDGLPEAESENAVVPLDVLVRKRRRRCDSVPPLARETASRARANGWGLGWGEHGLG